MFQVFKIPSLQHSFWQQFFHLVLVIVHWKKNYFTFGHNLVILIFLVLVD